MTPNPHPASGKRDYKLGVRHGIQWAITWLHERAGEMNDSKAKTILNTAAFNMGVEKKGEILEPASGNGDVIELAAQIIDPLAFSGLPDGDTVSFTQNIAWRKTEARKRAQSLASAGLLKLSEGSGSNRDAMVHVDAACGFLVSIRPRSDTGSAKKQAIESALEQLAGAKLALASVPEGSGDGKMREALATIANSECQNFGTDELRAIAREALATPAPSPIDAEWMREETDGEMLDRLGADGAAWAAEFRKIAIKLGYSDMDEGWLTGWFCNVIENTRVIDARALPAREIDRENLAEAMMNVERQENGFAPMRFAAFCSEEQIKYLRRAAAILLLLGNHHV